MNNLNLLSLPPNAALKVLYIYKSGCCGVKTQERFLIGDDNDSIALLIDSTEFPPPYENVLTFTAQLDATTETAGIDDIKASMTAAFKKLGRPEPALVIKETPRNGQPARQQFIVPFQNYYDLAILFIRYFQEALRQIEIAALQTPA